MLGRFDLDEEDAFTRRDHDGIHFAAQSGNMLADSQAGEHHPIVAVLNRFERGEELSFTAVGVGVRSGRVHAGHVQTLSALRLPARRDSTNSHDQGSRGVFSGVEDLNIATREVRRG